MSTTFIEDSLPETEIRRPAQTPRFHAYNAHRRTRGLLILSFEEYQERCEWMRIYRDTDDPEERATAARWCKAQDQPPRGRFDPDPSQLSPMPDHLRAQIDALFGPSRVGDVPKREF